MVPLDWPIFPSFATKIQEEFGSESEDVVLLFSQAVQIKSAKEMMMVFFIVINMFLIVKTSGRDIKDRPITPLREGFCVIELKYLAYLPLSRITVARQLRNRIGFLKNFLKSVRKRKSKEVVYGAYHLLDPVTSRLSQAADCEFLGRSPCRRFGQVLP